MTKILIVEDNELNLKLFRDLLTASKYEVVETPRGCEAFNLAKQENPDLVLLDIQLHGMSGYDVLEQFKQDDSLKNIPVLAVTAFAMKDDRERIISSGFDDYMSKPISIVPFLNMVKVYSA